MFISTTDMPYAELMAAERVMASRFSECVVHLDPALLVEMAEENDEDDLYALSLSYAAGGDGELGLAEDEDHDL